jgi:hypothetical protein
MQTTTLKSDSYKSVAKKPRLFYFINVYNEWELGSPTSAQFAVITELVNYVFNLMLL